MGFSRQRRHVLLWLLFISYGISFLCVHALAQLEETQVDISANEEIPGSAQDKNIHAIQILCAKEWPVRVTSLQSGNISEDVLFFSDNKVKLNNFYDDKKFLLSQVKVILLGDRSIRWETTQASDSGSRIDIKGEFKKGVMAGTFNWWPKSGLAQGFYFASIKEEDPVTRDVGENTGQVSTLESSKQ